MKPYQQEENVGFRKIVPSHLESAWKCSYANWSKKQSWSLTPIGSDSHFCLHFENPLCLKFSRGDMCFHVFLQDNFSLSSSPAQNTASQVKAVTLSKPSQVYERIR